MAAHSAQLTDAGTYSGFFGSLEPLIGHLRGLGDRRGAEARRETVEEEDALSNDPFFDQ